MAFVVVGIITPIVLYGTAVLQCQLNGVNFNGSVTRKWDVNDNLSLYNGYSINDSKYTEEVYPNGFGLVVHHFTETDLEKTYKCIYGFLQNSTKLSFRDDLLISLPSKVDKDITFFKNKVDLYVRFHGVLPVPNCTFTLNNVSIDKPFERNFTMVGPLYMATFGISLNIDSSCVNRLNVKCSILEEIVLAEEAVDDCNAADVSMLPGRTNTLLVVSAVLLIVGLLGNIAILLVKLCT